MKTKLLARLFLVLLLAELSLQLISVILFESRSVKTSIQKMINQSLLKGDTNLYFVGDSMTAGLGASHPNYSYPQWSERLFKKAGIQINCINLGVPGTSTLDHIEVLKKLPKYSSVILRTGENNNWNTKSYYKLPFVGFEIRLVKFLQILFRGTMNKNWGSEFSKDLHEKLLKIVRASELGVILYEYPKDTNDFMKLALERKQLVVIPHKGFPYGIDKEFLARDGYHLNDKGYYLDALEFVRGFGELRDIKGLDNLRLEAANRIVGDLLEKREKLLKEIVVQRDLNTDFRRKLFEIYLIDQTNLFVRNEKMDKRAKHIERILQFGFLEHNVPMNKLQNALEFENSTFKEVLFHLDFLQQFPHLDNPQYNGILISLTEKIERKFKVRIEPKKPLSFRANFFNPLEHCHLLRREAGLKLEEVSISKEWKEVFGEELNFLSHYTGCN